MPRKTKWVVRVIIPTNEESSDIIGTDRPHHTFTEFLEQLRRCGVIHLHKDKTTDQANKYLFDIYPPHGVDSEAWATMNAERMESFGYNAVKAPEWYSEQIRKIGGK